MRRHSPSKINKFILSHEKCVEKYPEPVRGAIRVSVGYPSRYHVAMANLGFHFLYGGLKKCSRLSVERFFSETVPFTLESGSKLAYFDIIFFSVSYEEDYMNVARMLHASGIPPDRMNRSKEHPIVIAGGAAPSANPAPLSAIVDAIALGEGEETLEQIVLALEEGSLSRHDLLERLARIRSVWVPEISSFDKGLSEPFRGENIVHSVVLTPLSSFPNTVLVEFGRGCPGCCAFCLATSIYAPCRFARKANLEKLLSNLTEKPQSIGLVSTAVAANPEFSSTVRMLLEMGIRVSFSSLRAEDIDEEKARLIGATATKTVALAPESGSEQTRFKLGKRVSDEQFFITASLLSEAGVRKFVLYFLVGCPAEGPKTVEATERFLERFRKASRGARICAHYNIVIPKARTPMQFYAMPRESFLEKAQSRFISATRSMGMEARTKSTRSAIRQALISLGDQRLGRAMAKCVAEGLSWKQSLEASGAQETFPHEEKNLETEFPWDEFCDPTEREFLWRRFSSIRESID